MTRRLCRHHAEWKGRSMLDSGVGVISISVEIVEAVGVIEPPVGRSGQRVETM